MIRMTPLMMMDLHRALMILQLLYLKIRKGISRHKTQIHSSIATKTILRNF